MAVEMKDLSQEAQRQVLAQVMKTMESKKYRPTPTTRKVGEKELVFERKEIAELFDDLLRLERSVGMIKNLKLAEKIVLENSYITTGGKKVAAVKVDVIFSYTKDNQKVVWIDKHDKKAEKKKDLLRGNGYTVGVVQ